MSRPMHRNIIAIIVRPAFYGVISRCDRDRGAQTVGRCRLLILLQIPNRARLLVTQKYRGIHLLIVIQRRG